MSPGGLEDTARDYTTGELISADGAFPAVGRSVPSRRRSTKTGGGVRDTRFSASSPAPRSRPRHQHEAEEVRFQVVIDGKAPAQAAAPIPTPA